jgi:hypothetical protein
MFGAIGAFNSDGLAAARYHGFYGVINTHGEVVIPFVYERITEYGQSCGCPDVGMVSAYNAAKRDGLWGIIDMEERVILPFEFTDIWQQYGLAVVYSGDWMTGMDVGLFDVTAREWVAEPGVYDNNAIWDLFDLLTKDIHFDDGLYWPRTLGGYMVGGTYHDYGLAVVAAEGHSEINGIACLYTGEIILPVQYSRLTIISANHATSTVVNQHYSNDSWDWTLDIFLIDIYANAVIAELTDGSLGNFHSLHGSMGEYIIFSAGERWGDTWGMGMIDSYGNIAAEPIHQHLYPFSGELLFVGDSVMTNGGVLVNYRTWEEVLPFHDMIDYLWNGLAVVNQGGETEPYREEFATVNGLWGFIDENAEYFIPPVMPYERLNRAFSDLVEVQVNGLWGWIRLNREEI